jgi:hypothetical protein
MDKMQRIQEFVKVSLEDDSTDLRGIEIKDASIHLGLGILMVLVVSVHLALSMWQFAVSILLAGYDLIAKVLTKIMSAPKVTKEI